MNKKPKYHFQCTDCGAVYKADEVRYLCPKCASKNTPDLPPKGVLKTLYDYEALKVEGVGFDSLKKTNYLELLPIENLASLPNLHIGKTPLYKQEKLEGKKLPFHLFLKDDSQNPTFSFKDRASALVSAYAKEQGFNTLVAASTGNAGSSLSGICAAQGQKAIIIVPQSAPAAKLTQIIMYGAGIVPVQGTYDDAFDLSIKATEIFGWYNRNTAFNPMTIEGKKTVSFELYEQLKQAIPDRIFVPVGDGVIISGVYKGYEDLLKLGIIDTLPTIVAVQSKGSDNLARNINQERFVIESSHTLADSISVDIPRNFYMAQQFINTYQGEVLEVEDSDIVRASGILSRNTGIFSEPAAATSFAGLLAYYKKGMLTENSKNVVLLTGSGLKDLNGVNDLISIPEAIPAHIDALKNLSL